MCEKLYKSSKNFLILLQFGDVLQRLGTNKRRRTSALRLLGINYLDLLESERHRNSVFHIDSLSSLLARFPFRH